MESDAKLSIGHCTIGELETAFVEVTNTGAKPINEVTLDWAYEFEAPRDASAEFPGDKPVFELGRKYQFVPSSDSPRGPLLVGQSRTFCFPAEWFPEMCSVIDSLSPERFSVRINIDGNDEVAIPGAAWSEFVRRRFPKACAPQPEVSGFVLPEDRHKHVWDLAGHIVQLSRGFKVYPPREVVDDPSVLTSEDIVDRLSASKWWLRFADGREEMLALPELMLLQYLIVVLKMQFDTKPQSGKVSIKIEYDLNGLMQPEVVRLSLSKFQLEGIKN